jgi:hypothetical protein
LYYQCCTHIRFYHSFILFIYGYSLGNFDPFATNENRSEISDQSHQYVNLPSLDLIQDHVHQSLETNETNSNDKQLEKAGPSLDLIDSHLHSHDNENSSIIESIKHSLIQPSLDFLDAQLHGGKEHVHNEKNQTDHEAADFDDFKHWLEEQNQTNQLTRFLLLQKEVNQFYFDDTKDLNDKLNRTIEELKLEKQQPKYDL